MIAHDLDLYRNVVAWGTELMVGVCNCGWSSTVDTQEDVIEQWEIHCNAVLYMEAATWEP